MTTTATDAWTLSDLPDQAGKTVVVTGCSLGGIGYHTALELARRNARVVLAGRTAAKLAEAEAGIRGEVPHAQLSPLEVDLADLASVRRAGAHAHTIGPIDVLVNNAGVMAPPYSRTVDGFELQMATNHFGPVPAHRPAAAAAGAEQRGARRDRLLADAPGRPARSAA